MAIGGGSRSPAVGVPQVAQWFDERKSLQQPLEMVLSSRREADERSERPVIRRDSGDHPPSHRAQFSQVSG